MSLWDPAGLPSVRELASLVRTDQPLNLTNEKERERKRRGVGAKRAGRVPENRAVIGVEEVINIWAVC